MGFGITIRRDNVIISERFYVDYKLEIQMADDVAAYIAIMKCRNLAQNLIVHIELTIRDWLIILL